MKVLDVYVDATPADLKSLSQQSSYSINGDQGYAAEVYVGRPLAAASIASVVTMFMCKSQILFFQKFLIFSQNQLLLCRKLKR